jgi:hypothetical protein
MGEQSGASFVHYRSWEQYLCGELFLPWQFLLLQPVGRTYPSLL